MKPCTDLRVFIFEGREFKRVRETDRQLETETETESACATDTFCCDDALMIMIMVIYRSYTALPSTLRGEESRCAHYDFSDSMLSYFIASIITDL